MQLDKLNIGTGGTIWYTVKWSQELKKQVYLCDQAKTINTISKWKQTRMHRVDAKKNNWDDLNTRNKHSGKSSNVVVQTETYKKQKKGAIEFQKNLDPELKDLRSNLELTVGCISEAPVWKVLAFDAQLKALTSIDCKPESQPTQIKIIQFFKIIKHVD